MSTLVNTKTARRRLVSYSSLADFAKDLDVLEAAHAAATLRRSGNRAPGSIFFHLAISIDGSFDGIPELKNAAPLLLRLIGPFVKKRVLAGSLRPGVRLSAPAQEALWNDATTFDDGLRQLRTAIARLDRPDAKPTAAHPVFGRLTPREWKTFHLRHAEQQMSFLQP